MVKSVIGGFEKISKKRRDYNDLENNTKGRKLNKIRRNKHQDNYFEITDSQYDYEEDNAYDREY